jgi:hypothetical protein
MALRYENMTNNELEIVKNSKGYDNIDLTKMKNGDTIVVTKKFAEAKDFSGETLYPGDTEPKKWTIYSTQVEYNGVDKVGIKFPKLHTPTAEKKPVSAEEIASRFNACGGEGDQVRITCTKEMGPAKYDFKPVHKKDDDIVMIDLAFELVQ